MNFLVYATFHENLKTDLKLITKKNKLTYLFANGTKSPSKNTPKSGPATEPFKTMEAPRTPSKFAAKNAIAMLSTPYIKPVKINQWPFKHHVCE